MNTFTPSRPGFTRRFTLSRLVAALGAILLLSSPAFAQAVYTWNGDGSNSGSRFFTPTNWLPARNTPAATDVLVFDGSVSNTGAKATCVVDFGNGNNSPIVQSIGKLQLTNNVQLSLQGPSNNNDGSVLRLGGAPGADALVVAAGSKLILSSNSSASNRYLVLQLEPGTHATIAGTLEFNTANSPARLVSKAGSNSIQFTSSSVCNVLGTEGSPFGTTGSNTLTASVAPYTDETSAGAVVFEPGASYNQLGGTDSNPFGTVASSSVATFAAGSYYVYTAGTLSPEGRTYGHLELRGSATVGGSNALVVQDNLSVTATGLTVALNTTGGTTAGNLKGSSTPGNTGVVAGSTLRFAPAGASSFSVGGETIVSGTLSVAPTTAQPFLVTLAAVTNSGTFSFYKSLAASTGTVVFGTDGSATTNTGVFDLAPAAGTITFKGNLLNSNTASSTFFNTVASGTVIFEKNLVNDGAMAFSATGSSPLSKVIFGGTAAQSLSGASAPTLNANTVLEINKPANHLTLNRSVDVAGGLSLQSGNVNTSATALLTLPLAAVVLGGSDNSFVNGPVVRTTPVLTATTPGSHVALFPVGKISAAGVKSYRPLSLFIATQATATAYTGEQLETPPAQAAAGLHHVSFRRAFALSPSVQPVGFSGTVTLGFGPDDFVNYPADPNFVVAKRDAGLWTSVGRSAYTGAANGGLPVSGTLTSDPALFNTFLPGSTFALASTVASYGFPGLNPLPVELTHFSATAKPVGISLAWATASEKNSDRFEVQRSAAGEVFETIGTVQAQGNSTSLAMYSYLDARPLPGRAYYRLRQVDVDRQFTFSTVVSATALAAEGQAAYPNPSTGFVTLPVAVGEVQYRVLNLLGQVLLSGRATGGEQLDLTGLRRGAFVLELTGPAGRHSQQLIRE